jgi:hypothetical protein
VIWDDDSIRALVGRDGLTAGHRSSFTRSELVAEIEAQHFSPPGSRGEAEALAERILRHPFVVRASGTAFAFPDEPERYTTVEVRDTEQEAVEQAEHRRGDDVAVLTPNDVALVWEERPTLSGDQAALVARLLTNGAGVDVVVHTDGEAAAYVLDAATAAWRQEGFDVIDLAYRESTVNELRQRGLDADLLGNYTAGTLRPEHYEHGRLRSDTVLVVHEAETSGTFPLDNALRQAARDEAKVVVVGDPRARPAGDGSGGGGLFRQLAEGVGSFHLARDMMGRFPRPGASTPYADPVVAATLRPLDAEAAWLRRRIIEDGTRLAALQDALRETPPWRLSQRRDLPDRIRIAERSLAAAQKRLGELDERRANLFRSASSRRQTEDPRQPDDRRHLAVVREAGRDTRHPDQARQRAVDDQVRARRDGAGRDR